MTARLSRLLTAVAGALVLSVALTGSSSAHAAYESSDPSDGESVSSPPGRVTAKFTEPVVDDSYLTVFDPCGQQVDNGDSLVAGDRITVTMSANRKGAYTVRFNVVSSVDGHRTSGKFGFSSTGGAACPGSEAPAKSDRSANEPSGSEGSEGAGAGGSGAVTSADERVAGTRETRAGKASQGTRGAEATKESQREASTEESDPGVELAQETPDPSPAGTDAIWEGIPLGAFLVALAIAAAIGAAGGSIYADIMGPKR